MLCNFVVTFSPPKIESGSGPPNLRSSVRVCMASVDVFRSRDQPIGANPGSQTLYTDWIPRWIVLSTVANQVGMKLKMDKSSDSSSSVKISEDTSSVDTIHSTHADKSIFQTTKNGTT